MKHLITAIVLGALIGYGMFELIEYGIVSFAVIMCTYNVLLCALLVTLNVNGETNEN
jgi:uncharacterized membrane protein YgaE (UPF0421/DUF939 family)